MSPLFDNPLSAPERATVTCACGARLTVRAFTYFEAREQTAAFLAAHRSCRAAQQEPDATPTSEERRDA